MPAGKLSNKQKLFVDEYMKDRNGKQAAIRAGYSEKTAESQASRLLSKAKVAESVAKASVEAQERTQIDQDYIINSIVDTVERCRQVKPVYDRKGEHVVIDVVDDEGNKSEAKAYTFDSSGALKGLDMLAKHMGMYIERKANVNTDGEDVVTAIEVVYVD